MMSKKKNNQDKMLDRMGRILLNRSIYDAPVSEKLVFFSKEAEKQFNDMDEPVKKSMLNLLRESADEMTRKVTMDSLIECVRELQDRVLELEANKDKEETCEACKNKADRVHLMVHLLLPVLNSDHPLVGQAAMTQLIISKAQDHQIKREVFLKKMGMAWDEMEAANPNNSDDDDEDDDGEDDDE
jgi:hypothetical protein